MPLSNSSSFDPAAYGPVFAPLLATERRRALGPGTPVLDARRRLGGATVESAFAHMPLVDAEAGALCIAGAWLLYDGLDESHVISQSIETPSGSYWHGIMHRREPDYANAKYWFRRVGRHPVYAQLAAEARRLTAGSQLSQPLAAALQTGWDPMAFVDFCEAVAAGKCGDDDLGRSLAAREWELLFDDCYRQAVGKPGI